MFGRLTAFSLALWLAGFGCLLGCEAAPAARAAAHAQPAHASARSESHAARQRESCSKMRGHGGGNDRRAKAGGDSDARTSIDAGAPTGGDPAHCPLGRQTRDLARKVFDADTPPPASALTPRPPAPEETSRAADAPTARVARVPDRGSTRLRCCVFLI